MPLQQNETKEQLELSLEQPAEGEQGPNPISQGTDAPHITLSFGAASSVWQIAAWQISPKQPGAAQTINIKGSALKDVFSWQ